MHRDCRDSQSGKASSCCRGSSGGGGGEAPLRKGPWTSAEDALLIEYVQKHGEGKWNAIQRCTVLRRCGKSCRLRWANHLRPGLKKGGFTPEEEQEIIKLHAKFGNKWARMALELPGRTDNEIKNYWNTRLKRFQRAGLPIYPEDVRIQLMNKSLCGRNTDGSTNEETHDQDPLQANDFEFPDVEFKYYNVNQGFLWLPSVLTNLPSSGMLNQGLVAPSNPYSLMISPTMPTGFDGESETLTRSLDDYNTINDAHGVGHGCDLAGDHPSGIFTSEDPSVLDHALLSGNGYDMAGDNPFGIFTSEELDWLHDALLSGSFSKTAFTSSSEPVTPGLMNLELPSIQYLDTQQDGCLGTLSYPVHSLELADTLLQSPLTHQTQTDCPASRKCGLLESVLYESLMVNSSTNLADSLEPNWGNSISLSPFVHSSSLVFSQPTPTGGTSSGEDL